MPASWRLVGFLILTALTECEDEVLMTRPCEAYLSEPQVLHARFVVYVPTDSGDVTQKRSWDLDETVKETHASFMKVFSSQPAYWTQLSEWLAKVLSDPVKKQDYVAYVKDHNKRLQRIIEAGKNKDLLKPTPEAYEEER